MNQYIVVLPYIETNRLFHASKSTKQEAFIGKSGIVYYQTQAKKMTENEASKLATESGNVEAFIRPV